MDTLAWHGEFGTIENIKTILQELGLKAPGTVLGVGDDAAIIKPDPAMELVISCDVQVEGRHYLPCFGDAYQRGRRAMAVNISDLAAMGGQPRYALVSLGLQEDTILADIKEMYRGFSSELIGYDAEIIGGNLSRVEQGSFIDITIVGEVEQGKAVRRSGGEPGDVVLMTGYPGQAAAGLRWLQEGRAATEPLAQAYLQPTPRAQEGRAMGRSGLVRAMIDISDGLVADLGHLCQASGTGACLMVEQLPSSVAMREVAANWGLSLLELQCAPSDEYELLLCCRAQDINKLRQICLSVNGPKLHEIGYMTDSKEGIYCEDSQGQRQALKGSGWDHFNL